jgi:hypothetical protein
MAPGCVQTGLEIGDAGGNGGSVYIRVAQRRWQVVGCRWQWLPEAGSEF